MAKIAEYMTKDVISTGGGSTIAEAIASMKKNSIGSLLVKEGDATVGIFTERDLLNKVDFNVPFEPNSRYVKEVMSTDLKTVGHDETYTDVIEKMRKWNIRHVPVVKDGRVIGLVSRRDLLNHYYENIESLLEEMVIALSFAVEKRDPYTAGHQQHVTQLARAIAVELGFPDKMINGVKIAAIVHDVGKVYIPAEILNKPGKLSEAENDLIRSHPQVGCDILKPIEFPWPIAEIVLQHHERLDGSGYPNQLTVENILPEAKIIGIADVVEAMSLPRPYRDAIGTDKALEEILQYKGVLYDSVAVDACIKLFKEKAFKFD